MNEMFSQGGKGSTGILTNIQAIARACNVAEGKVILSTNTNTLLDDKTVLFDRNAKKIWSLPALPAGATIVNVDGDQLTYNPGGITVSLLPAPNDIAVRVNEAITAVYDELASNTGSNKVGHTTGRVGEVARTVQAALGDWISLKDFGAVGDGITDDTAAIQAMVAWVNSRAKYSAPISVIFPAGHYKYTTGINFTRPVAVYGFQSATLDYSGTGAAMYLGDPTPEDAPTADNFYQSEYTVEGLRFTGGTQAGFGIFIKSFVFTPRIRYCIFMDYGNSATYDIYSQYENWDGIIECCEKHTYFSTVATGSFIALLGKKTDGSAYDGGNSRFTIRDCSMGAYDNQDLGYFAYINSTMCRVIGGNAHHCTGGILLGPNAHGAIIDGYYTEVSTAVRPWMVSVLSDKTNPANYLFPQSVRIRNCYINMHSEKIGNNGRIIGMMDGNVKLRDWVVEDIAVSTFANGQVLIDMNNLDEQVNNTFARINPVFIPYNSGAGAKFTVVNNPPLSPNAWTSSDVIEGTWTPSVGGNATYNIQKGKYRKEGRKVTVEFDIHINTIGTGNQSAILGLPFACGDTTGTGSVGYYSELALPVYGLYIRADALNSNIMISASTASAVGISGSVAALGNNSRIVGTLVYFV